MQKYLVMTRLASDTEIWMPGSMIELDDRRAAVHLKMGNVKPLDDTVAPALMGSSVVVHEPLLAASSTSSVNNAVAPTPDASKKKKGDEG